MTGMTDRKKRAFAWLSAAVLLAGLIFSLTFVAVHLDHDCTGEDCPVCAEIGTALNVIHVILGAAAGAACVFLMSDGLKESLSLLHGRSICPVSLIRLKIRMND